jgi:hypothetical protein
MSSVGWSFEPVWLGGQRVRRFAPATARLTSPTRPANGRYAAPAIALSDNPSFFSEYLEMSQHHRPPEDVHSAQILLPGRASHLIVNNSAPSEKLHSYSPITSNTGGAT